MKIMVLGDCHGNTPWTTNVVKHAARHKVKKIIQCGDFGLWDHFSEGVTFLDALNEQLRRDGTKLYAVGGNHENWLRWNWYIENNPKTDEGFTILRSHIFLIPKTMHWSWQGKQFAAAGGAVSIDKDRRLKLQEETGPDTLFWWDEQLLDCHVDAFPDKKVDYLFTHDCSNATPWRGRLKPDFESQMHRQRIDAVLKKSRPSVHFHGHMHTKYDWMNRTGGDNWTQTYGLECDGMFWSWGILDLATDEFVFVPNIPRVEPKEIEKETILEGEVCQ
jgi:predicted phosphodiesterase